METSPTTLELKLGRLNAILDSLQKVVIAFSGGTDSALLAAAAQRRLQDNAVAVTAFSASLAMTEQTDAVSFAELIGIRHILLPADELASEGFRLNGPERCYHCKKLRFGLLESWAVANGFDWIAEGSNTDDTGDYRPGMKALADMPRVRSPLMEAGFSKAEVRALSREWKLPTWNKPSAACLASRIAYGQPIDAVNLGQVEQAEAIIRRYAAGQVRVRHHNDVARIEVEPGQIPLLTQPETAAAITAGLKQLGFSFVALDLAGYRMGSLNEVL